MEETTKKEDTFICRDCKKEFPAIYNQSNDLNICEKCLDEYPNETGFCSPKCRITGDCDESC